MPEWLNDITLLDELLLGGMLLLWAYELYFWLRYMQGVNRWNRRLRKGKIKRSEVQPPVSVIVCAKNEEQNLSDYLPHLLQQKYPQFEVIVVDDGSEDNTRLVVERLKYRYQNLRLTFVPHEAWVTSSKKLALTLAAKAAQYDYLLLTDADCRPESQHWIADMMSVFTDDVELVLGYGAYFEKKSALNRFIQFDALTSGMQYLGMAAAHHPYMGVGRNLAYRKQTFFENHGFAGLLGNRAGDDDLFVNKVANKRNTAIMATVDSLTWSVPKQRWHDWWQQKRRHLGVSPQYKAQSKFRLTLEPLVRGLMYGVMIAICILCPWMVTVAAAVLMLSRWLWQLLIVNATAHRFRIRRFGLNLLFFDIFFPLMNMCLLLHNTLFPQKQRW